MNLYVLMHGLWTDHSAGKAWEAMEGDERGQGGGASVIVSKIKINLKIIN